jgi:DNA-binding response OmpR family regulator
MPKGTKILLVDDDQTLVEMYNERLTAAGYKVTVAHEGESALELVNKEKFDIMLLDVLMPKINGFDVLDRLRANIATKDIPVIVLTALVQDTNKERSISGGADDYIIKSETMPGEVISKVEAVLERRKHPSTNEEPQSQPSAEQPSDQPKEEGQAPSVDQPVQPPAPEENQPPPQ